MRYLIYTETFPSRDANDARQTGIGRYCADIASGLQAMGHDVLVLTNDDIGGGSGPVEEVSVEVLGRSPCSGLDQQRRKRQVLRRIRQVRPDYVLIGDPLGHNVLASIPVISARLACPI